MTHSTSASTSAGVPVIVERDVWIPMRDGVLLQADIWRPATEGRYPVLLQRTPYNRADSFGVIVNAAIEPLRAVADGFVVVIQDTRGRFGSQGQFEPFMREAADGYDTIQWLAGQPYSNGKVGMYGASYYAATQLLAATLRPPALKAIVPQVTGSDYHDTWVYQGGALQLGFTLYWALGLAAAELARRQAAGESLEAEAGQLQILLADPWSAFKSRPLAEIGALTTLLPAWNQWLEHSSHDEYWQAISIAERYASLDVPALHIGGWFDLFLRGTIANYQGMSKTDAPQRLIVGPWAHAVTYDALGEVEYGGAAAAAALDMTGLHLNWFSSFLKEEPAQPSGSPVKVFVMGDNTWRDEDAWPPARSRFERFFLSAGSGAGGAAGQLRREAPDGDEESSSYAFDPAEPVPTVGGATFLPGAYIGLHAGQRDQRAVEQRPDVLTFTSEALSADLELCGPVTVTLYAATSAADTDWTAKLVDVHPGGRALNICDGIIRARYRHGVDHEELATPGEPHEFQIDLGHTSIVLFAGHALRLEISSSNFPRFDVNPGHGGVNAQSTADDYVIAHQRVFYDQERPSYVEICTVPRPKPLQPRETGE